MSFTGVIISRGVIYDDNGRPIKTLNFKPYGRSFSWGQRSYNIDLKNGSWHKVKRILWDTNYYAYNLNDPNPLIFKKVTEPVMNSDLYNATLETKVAREINNLAKSTFAQLMTPRNMIIVLAIVGAIIYFARGGTIT